MQLHNESDTYGNSFLAQPGLLAAWETGGITALSPKALLSLLIFFFFPQSLIMSLMSFSCESYLSSFV